MKRVRKRRNDILRDDRRKAPGFVVSFTRRGRVASVRFFSDRKYGGREAAQAAAEEWRDEQLLALYPPLRIRRFHPTNKTGVMGVHVERYKVEGRAYQRYRVSWPDGHGGEVRRSFSLSKYGPERAFALAVEARRAGILELENKVRSRLAREVAERRRRTL
jgi:hypothetical protein